MRDLSPGCVQMIIGNVFTLLGILRFFFVENYEFPVAFGLFKLIIEKPVVKMVPL